MESLDKRSIKFEGTRNLKVKIYDAAKGTSGYYENLETLINDFLSSNEVGRLIDIQYVDGGTERRPSAMVIYEPKDIDKKDKAAV